MSFEKRIIYSPSNELIRSLRKLQERKGRVTQGAFFIEGLRIVGEALQTHQPIRHLIYCPQLLTSDFGLQSVAQAERRGLDIIQTSPAAFLALASREGPQGIAAVIEMRRTGLDAFDGRGAWISLVDVQDPGNLGSILRSADAAGMRGLILIGDGTDPWHPTAARASMGALFTQVVIQTEINVLREWKNERGIDFIGALSQKSCAFHDYNYPRDLVLLLGSEQKGLPPDYSRLCDGFVHIPMRGSVDSLNLASAASIIMFEIMHQHSKKRKE